MSNKKISLSAGGRDLVLDFGINQFYESFKEGTGVDIFQFGKLEEVDSTSSAAFARGLIYGGHIANAVETDTNHTLSFDEVKKMVAKMSPEETNELIANYNKAVGVGELKGQEKETA